MWWPERCGTGPPCELQSHLTKSSQLPGPPCLLQVLDRLSSPGQEWQSSIQFCYWLQYHLHKQLLQASQYAGHKHVALKGDLPIGALVPELSGHPALYRTRSPYPLTRPPYYFHCRRGQVQRGHLAVPQAVPHGRQHRCGDLSVSCVASTVQSDCHWPRAATNTHSVCRSCCRRPSRLL